MTMKELSQLSFLKREIEADQRRLWELEAFSRAAARTRRGAEAAGRGAEEIAGLREIIEEKRRRCLREAARLERFILGVEDSLTRQIFQFRFIDGLTYDQIAARLGGGNTCEGVRKRVYRCLHK